MKKENQIIDETLTGQMLAQLLRPVHSPTQQWALPLGKMSFSELPFTLYVVVSV